MHAHMPLLGQGTWHMGEKHTHRNEEIASLKAGIDNGVYLIDTAEMYADGEAEAIVREAIRGIRRDTLYIVSKVYPHNAHGQRMERSLSASLRRLGTDYLDMYLLHWRGSHPLEETVMAMERLVRQGRILRWGVSNLDTEDMEELFGTPAGQNCAANQVLYHLGSRGIEYDLLPWMDAHALTAMAYCPLAQGGWLRRGLLESDAVRIVAQKYAITPHQVLLGFVLAKPGMVAIPKAATVEHALQNAQMAHTRLDPEDIALLSGAFPAPTEKVPLDIQ